MTPARGAAAVLVTGIVALTGCAGGPPRSANESARPAPWAVAYRVDDPQAPTLRALVEAADRDPTAWATVADLSRTIGARLAGTRNEADARAWAIRLFRRLGFENVREETFAIEGWVRGEEYVDVAAAGRRLRVGTLGGSVATPPRGLDAPVVGFASLDDLRAAAPRSLEGRIAFVDGTPFERSRLGAGYGDGAERRTSAATEAARRGALAVLVRSAGASPNFVHVGQLRYADDVAPIPAASVGNADADWFAARLRGGELRIRLVLTPRRVPNARSGNVIAEWVGRERPQDIVLLGAHLDSWDVGTGAVDDGAGVAIVTATLRAIATHAERPRRTIRVVLFGAEEFRLQGARDYATRHGSERHVLATEADFGSAPVWGFYTRVPDAALPAMDRIQRALAPLGVERGHNRAAGGEDLTFLRQQGVPVASLVQDGTRYFDVHHSAGDTLEAVDAAGLRQNVAALAVFAWLAATHESTAP